eukprot:2150112-Pleurochrysis_carterae.AAC.1
MYDTSFCAKCALRMSLPSSALKRTEILQSSPSASKTRCHLRAIRRTPAFHAFTSMWSRRATSANSSASCPDSLMCAKMRGARTSPKSFRK